MGRGPGHQNKYNPGYHKGDNRAGGGGARGGGGKNTRSPFETHRRHERELEESEEPGVESEKFPATRE